MNLQGKYAYLVECYPYAGAQVFAKYEDAKKYIDGLAKRYGFEWEPKHDCYYAPGLPYGIRPARIRIS